MKARCTLWPLIDLQIARELVSREHGVFNPVASSSLCPRISLSNSSAAEDAWSGADSKTDTAVWKAMKRNRKPKLCSWS